MSTWRERLADLDEARWESDRSRANPHHGPSQRTWVESAVDENGWGVMVGGPLINSFEGGAAGTLSGALSGGPQRSAPAGAVHFARDIWQAGGKLGSAVAVYMVSEPSWEHVADKSPCDHGTPCVPLGEWTTLPVPFTCAEGLEICPRQSGEPYWVDLLA